jgi:hypothetical protein
VVTTEALAVAVALLITVLVAWRIIRSAGDSNLVGLDGTAAGVFSRFDDNTSGGDTDPAAESSESPSSDSSGAKSNDDSGEAPEDADVSAMGMQARTTDAIDTNSTDGTQVFDPNESRASGGGGTAAVDEVTLRFDQGLVTVPCCTPVRRKIRRELVDSGYAEMKARHVSREHLRFKCQDESLQVTDMGSSGGTQVNGTTVTPGQWINIGVGDQLTLADDIKLTVQVTS